MATSQLKAPPICLSLLLSDALHRDMNTGKFTILGTFNGLVAPHYPNTLPSLAIYYVLSGGRGQVHITTRIVSAGEEEQVVAQNTDAFYIPDPLAMIELGHVFTDVTFPGAGAYRVQVLCGEEVLLERRLTAELPD
jgi:hypothetical protein